MKCVLALAAVLAVASAFSPASLKPVLELSREQRATHAWAVLVAGSNTYSNYRHQSDICQMFQTLRKLGLPEERIIVLMYDDIAQSSQNPRKGVVINTPNGPDVYKGVPKDYTGKLVTPKNFLDILAGKAPAGGSGKQLLSTTNDNVFVFFSDHGGLGLLAFPTAELYDSELEAGLQTMYKNGKYGKLVFNVEACEAGSMFYKAILPPNAYFHTASPVSESSYAWQWDDSVGAYVSDVWSWYAVHDMEDHPEHTMQQLFDTVYTDMSNYSIPCQYGDLSIAGITTHDFMASSDSSAARRLSVPKDAVKAFNVSLNAAIRRHAANPSAETLATLKSELAIHAAIDKLDQKLIRAVGLNGALNNDPKCNAADNVAECVREVATAYRESCNNRHEYFAKVYETIWGICAAAPANNAVRSRAISTLKGECTRLIASL